MPGPWQENQNVSKSRSRFLTSPSAANPICACEGLGSGCSNVKERTFTTCHRFFFTGQAIYQWSKVFTPILVQTQKPPKKYEQVTVAAPGPYQLQALLLHLHLQPTPELNVASFMRPRGTWKETNPVPISVLHVPWGMVRKLGLPKIRIHPRFLVETKQNLPKGPEALSFKNILEKAEKER